MSTISVGRISASSRAAQRDQFGDFDIKFYQRRDGGPTVRPAAETGRASVQSNGTYRPAKPASAFEARPRRRFQGGDAGLAVDGGGQHLQAEARIGRAGAQQCIDEKGIGFDRQHFGPQPRGGQGGHAAIGPDVSDDVAGGDIALRPCDQVAVEAGDAGLQMLELTVWSDIDDCAADRFR